MNKQAAIYNTKGATEVGHFLDAITPMIEAGEASGKVLLDSINTSVSNGGIEAPAELQKALDISSDDVQVKLLDSVLLGIKGYEARNGVAPTADVVEAAMQQARVALMGIGPDGRLLDSATSAAHDPGSLQANRAMIAVTYGIAEAIPFAGYTPVDIKSNEGLIAIVSHKAGSNYGDYPVGSIMDGVSAGNVYASSARMVRFDHSGGAPYSSRFTDRNLASDQGFCDPAATGVPVLRGRTEVLVNGKRAAMDALQGASANSPISGSVRIGSTDYAITGSVTVATGVISITATPDFPPGTEVVAEAYVDYETAPGLIPSVIVSADMYSIYANPWRVKTSATIDAQTQLANELGVDAMGEAMAAVRVQAAMERHYKALNKAFLLGKNNEVGYDFEYSTQIAQKNRAQIWQDFQSVLGAADQDMANATMDHGITHLYVPAFIAAQMQSLPADLFVSSGVTARPGVYRVGRLFGKYEVYYSPKVVSQSADLATATILAIGRSTQVARCPIILGDAVSPMPLELSRQSDLVAQAALYARDFTVTNPHEASALGCARINVTNLK